MRLQSFNPCCGGFSSKTAIEKEIAEMVEPSFNPCCGGFSSKTCFKFFFSVSGFGFNPCCGGFSSKTNHSKIFSRSFPYVSILVVVDFPLRLYRSRNIYRIYSEFQSLLWWIFL